MGWQDQLVRCGTVSAIDTSKRLARVMYPDLGITSGWLPVLDTHPHIPDYDPATQKTESTSGGSSYAMFESHSHNLTIKPWMPNVNDKVVVLYLQAFNADGVILGAISG